MDGQARAAVNGIANQFVLAGKSHHFELHVEAISAKSFYLPQTQTVRWKEKSEMPLAFVLISAEVGSENEALKELKAIEQVKEAYMVYGVYDIVAKIQAETMDKLKEVITRKVRRLNKINSTLTMMVIE